MPSSTEKITWHKVLEPEELAEGRVKSATCAHLTLCMTRFNGQYAALDNKCPHQGGPLAKVPLRTACYAAHGTVGTTIR